MELAKHSPSALTKHCGVRIGKLGWGEFPESEVEVRILSTLKSPNLMLLLETLSVWSNFQQHKLERISLRRGGYQMAVHDSERIEENALQDICQPYAPTV